MGLRRQTNRRTIESTLKASKYSLQSGNAADVLRRECGFLNIGSTRWEGGGGHIICSTSGNRLNPFFLEVGKLGMFGSISRLAARQFRTGAISNDTKVGRLAKMLRFEVLNRNEIFSFTAFGANLIGKTVKAASIAQTSSFDDANSAIPADRKIMLTPFNFDSDEKLRASIPSVQFIISSDERADDRDVSPEIKVASRSTAEIIAQRIHTMYLKSQNRFTLSCVGDEQAAIAAEAMAIFNARVESHKLAAWISNELVHDMRSGDKTMRKTMLNVNVVRTADAHLPK